jgi:deazaflavin-dependent oxidoreductase (nitroreductase family)
VGPNLVANPNAEVEIRGERLRMRARVAEDGERAALWEAMTDLYSGLDKYRERTARELLIFVLTPSVRSGAVI